MRRARKGDTAQAARCRLYKQAMDDCISSIRPSCRHGVYAQGSCGHCHHSAIVIKVIVVVTVISIHGHYQRYDCCYCLCCASKQQQHDPHLLTRVLVCWGLVPLHHPLLPQHLHPGLHEDLPMIGSCPDAPHIFQYPFAFQPPSASLLPKAYCTTASTLSTAGTVP